jgi:uncharacterized LabA/DUF88 family protein
MAHPANQAVPTATQYLYVDGASLRGRIENVSRQFFKGTGFDVDFQRLKGAFTKVFYYDAVPVREDGEDEATYDARIGPIRAVFDAATATDGVHVYEGDARRRRRRGLEQKKVDVMLTVDMLSHTFQRNMLSTTLLTGDGDFKPLVDALVHMGMFVTLWYPANETSQELMQAADNRLKLGWYDLQSILTPASQQAFDIPQPHHSGAVGPVADVIFQWKVDGKDHGIYYLRSDGKFLVTRQDDDINVLYMKHSNLELLKQCCLEARNIDIPTEGVNAASAFQPPAP